MQSPFSRKEESRHQFMNSPPHKSINITRSLLYAYYDLIEECSRNLMIKLNVICFVTVISIAENHIHIKTTRNTHHILNTIVTFHYPDKSMLEE